MSLFLLLAWSTVGLAVASLLARRASFDRMDTASTVIVLLACGPIVWLCMLMAALDTFVDW